MIKITGCFFLLCLLALNLSAQKIYYIDSKGNNRNTGTSPDQAWKSILKITPGSTYLFKRGDIFFFEIQRVDNFLLKPILLNAFGKGSKPILSLYSTVKQSSWRLYKPNVWRVKLNEEKNFTGFVDFTNSNVGFIKIGKSIMGGKKRRIEDLKTLWDFYSDDSFLYVFTKIHLNSFNKAIRITTDHHIIQLTDGMRIENLRLLGTGGHGIRGVNCKDIVIRNVDVSEVGGSYLQNFGNGTTRYGNGIEFLKGASNCLIEYCTVTKAYDVAYTMQSRAENSTFDNVNFRFNKADSNEQSFEFWIEKPSSKFSKCKFTGNTCINAGYGWSHKFRPDRNSGVHVLNYYSSLSDSQVTITDNTFKNAKNGYIHFNQNPNFNAYKNKIYLKRNTPLIMAHPLLTITGGGSFTTKFGIEKGSVFKRIKE